jgi:predicted nucleotidyltransferase
MAASGRFIVRIPPSLHAHLREVAAQRGTSLNALCAAVLSAGTHADATSAVEPSDIVRACRAAFGERLEGIVLFGSLARGEATAASDADLLLVLAHGTRIERGLYHEWDTLDASHHLLAGHPCTPQFVALPDKDNTPGGLWYEVALDGQVLWDRRGAIARTLRMLRLDMLSGVMERRVTHGHPYWVKRYAQSRPGF